MKRVEVIVTQAMCASRLQISSKIHSNQMGMLDLILAQL